MHNGPQRQKHHQRKGENNGGGRCKAIARPFVVTLRLFWRFFLLVTHASFLSRCSSAKIMIRCSALGLRASLTYLCPSLARCMRWCVSSISCLAHSASKSPCASCLLILPISLAPQNSAP